MAQRLAHRVLCPPSMLLTGLLYGAALAQPSSENYCLKDGAGCGLPRVLRQEGRKTLSWNPRGGIQSHLAQTAAHRSTPHRWVCLREGASCTANQFQPSGNSLSDLNFPPATFSPLILPHASLSCSIFVAYRGVGSRKRDALCLSLPGASSSIAGRRFTAVLSCPLRPPGLPALLQGFPGEGAVVTSACWWQRAATGFVSLCIFGSAVTGSPLFCSGSSPFLKGKFVSLNLLCSAQHKCTSPAVKVAPRASDL